MHIPDSAISPMSSLISAAAMTPAWVIAGRSIRRELSTSSVPRIAIGSAFAFTIMMFNVPVFGGTTVHPVGSVLLAILVGPWAAVIGATVALAIQALFFADGGVLALGANAFTMAFAMPVVGYTIYALIAGRTATQSSLRVVGAAAGAFVGINVAALLTAIILGIQPALHHSGGHALYFPFGLGVTIPAIMLPHLTVAGGLEAIVTATAVRFLQAACIPIHGADGQGPARGPGLLWTALAALAALTPLGLLARGEAWGEWSREEITHRAGYTPAGLAHAEERGWKGFNVLPDYLSERGPVFYIGAALAGIALAAGTTLLLGKTLARRSEGRMISHTTSPPDSPDAGAESHELPTWMTGHDDAPVVSTTSERRAPVDFVSRTLSGLAESARDTLSAEESSARPGLMQAIEPRVKVLGILGLVILTAIQTRLPIVAALWMAALALGGASRLGARALLARPLAATALFLGVVAIPAALNVVTPGPPALVLLLHPFLAVTLPGLETAAIIAVRGLATLTLIASLVHSTRWNDLLAALRVICVPRPIIAVLAMTYRYLAVMAQSAAEMMLARRARTVGSGQIAEKRRFVGRAVGALFGRTMTLSEEVHAAMVARGWSGTPHGVALRRISLTDVMWLAAVAAVGAAVLGFAHGQ